MEMDKQYYITMKKKEQMEVNKWLSPKNSKLEIYMTAGRQALKYLENIISNEALYWKGQ